MVQNAAGATVDELRRSQSGNNAAMRERMCFAGVVRCCSFRHSQGWSRVQSVAVPFAVLQNNACSSQTPKRCKPEMATHAMPSSYLLCSGSASDCLATAPVTSAHFKRYCRGRGGGGGSERRRKERR